MPVNAKKSDAKGNIERAAFARFGSSANAISLITWLENVASSIVPRVQIVTNTKNEVRNTVARRSGPRSSALARAGTNPAAAVLVTNAPSKFGARIAMVYASISGVVPNMRVTTIVLTIDRLYATSVAVP